MKRWSWPIPSEKDLKKDIEKSYQITFPEKLNRFKFIYKEFGPPCDMLLSGGHQSLYAINEMKFSFFQGNFLSTILCAHVFLENEIGGHLILNCKDKEAEGGFASIINAAEEEGLIDSRITKRLRELKDMRVTYTHPKVGVKKRSHIKRVVDKNLPPDDLLEEDAKESIRIVVDYIRFMSPDWTPENFK